MVSNHQIPLKCDGFSLGFLHLKILRSSFSRKPRYKPLSTSDVAKFADAYSKAGRPLTTTSRRSHRLFWARGLGREPLWKVRAPTFSTLVFVEGDICDIYCWIDLT